MYRVWMALSDTSREFSGVQGYLKASMTVLRGNDVPPSHSADDEVCVFTSSANVFHELPLRPQLWFRPLTGNLDGTSGAGDIAQGHKIVAAPNSYAR